MSRIPLALMMRGTGFSGDPRFAGPVACANDAGPLPQSGTDIPDTAFDDGFAEGFARGRESALAESAERDARREMIELAFARFDQRSAEELRERLRQTVLALCEATVQPLAWDSEALSARIARSVEMLQRSQDERRVLVHPEDLALVRDRLPADLVLEGDASVERGGLRIETDDGGIEDGPSQWRRILSEAFREC